MKIKTADLVGPALNWAVNRANNDVLAPVEYSTKWEFGGPIIEREQMTLDSSNHPDLWPWTAIKVIGWEKREDEEMGDWPVYAEGVGDTPLVAAMRCYVTSRLGDEVDVPDEFANT